jgi:hypothetical protein
LDEEASLWAEISAFVVLLRFGALYMALTVMMGAAVPGSLVRLKQLICRRLFSDLSLRALCYFGKRGNQSGSADPGARR